MPELNPWDLKKQGRLNEALTAARQLLQENPEDLRAKGCAFWCLYDLAKGDLEQLVSLGTDARAGEVRRLLKVLDVRVSELLTVYTDDEICRQSVGWLVAKAAWRAAKCRASNSVAAMVKRYRKAIPQPTAQGYHSLLLRAVLELEPPPSWFAKFIQYWRLNNLQDDDYCVFAGDSSDAKKPRGRSLAAKVVSATCKHYALHRNEDSSWFDEIAPSILRRIQNDDWVNYHMAQYKQSRQDFQAALDYTCAALVATPLSAPAWSLVASVLDSLGYSEAAFVAAFQACSRGATVCGRRPYELISQALERRGQTESVRFWQGLASRLAGVWTASDPNEKRKKHKELCKLVRSALDDLQEDINRTSWTQFEQTGRLSVGLVVVEHINREKPFVWVRSQAQGEGERLNVSGWLRSQVMRSGAGTVLEVLRDNDSGTILIARLAPPERHPEFLKEMKGRFSLAVGRDFGFVRVDGISAFVPPNLVTQHDLRNGAEVTVVAIVNYDKKRSQEGWKVIRVLSSSASG